MAESVIGIRQDYGKAEMAIWDYLISVELRNSKTDIHDMLVRRYGHDVAVKVIKTGNALARLTDNVKELQGMLDK